MANLKLTLAAALLCGSAALAAPAFANGDHAANSGANAPTASSTQSNPAQDATENEQANDENSNDEQAGNDENDNQQTASIGGEHGLSTPEEKAETAALNQAQAVANGNARSGITRSSMGESRGGVSSGTPTSMHKPAPTTQDQDQDDDQSSDSNDANGGTQSH